jgi:hypothetical protein
LPGVGGWCVLRLHGVNVWWSCLWVKLADGEVVVCVDEV